jgi:Flp pilus assembly pilin Flp
MAYNLSAHRRPSVMGSLIRRFVIEDGGQDLIEYAIIAVFFGIVGVLVMQAIQKAVGTTYDVWLDPTVGTPSLWDPAEPIGGGS